MGELHLGTITITVALPRMAHRYRIAEAWYAVASEGKTPGRDAFAIGCAAIGLCWGEAIDADHPKVVVEPPPGDFVKSGRDAVAYGDDVLDHLVGLGLTQMQIAKAGGTAIRLINESLPSEEAIEAAADPSGATKAPSTGTSSPSASPGTETPSPSTSAP